MVQGWLKVLLLMSLLLRAGVLSGVGDSGSSYRGLGSGGGGMSGVRSLRGGILIKSFIGGSLRIHE